VVLEMGLLSLLIAAPVDGSRQQTPVFPAESRMVNLTVSVTDRRGRYLSGLTADDFFVYEDGEQRPIALFRTEELHLDLVIVMDTSASMRGALVKARSAARQLVRTLKPDDHVSVITFSTGVYRACAFTSDPAVIDAALQYSPPADDGSRVFRALVDAFDELSRHEEDRERRQAVVLLTDGLDNDTLFGDDEWLFRRAGLADTILYVIEQPVSLEDREDYRNPRNILERLAKLSGGTVFPMNSPYALNFAYVQIGRELHAQYRIGYEPSDRRPAGQWRTIQVSVRGETSVKHRLKYFAASPR